MVKTLVMSLQDLEPLFVKRPRTQKPSDWQPNSQENFGQGRDQFFSKIDQLYATQTRFLTTNVLNFPFHQKRLCRLGVPTFKKISSDLAGWWKFRTIFHKNFKNINLINVGHTLSKRQLCPRSLRTGSATGYVGRVGASRGFVCSKNQDGYFFRIEKLMRITC